MASGQAVDLREPLIAEMLGRPVITEGHRNDDCVNLAIIAWAEKGPFKTAGQLLQGINEVIEEYMLDGSDTDNDYLLDKCGVLMEYLPHWAENPWAKDGIWSYAII